ncbi:MAG: AmmeMemoRadiSam system radical SAM enzyme [Clostridiaceae bacterium]|nr:AmmeMemoRadiSam system radical SAM enzyme [Clostridiaceae bacterium]
MDRLKEAMHYEKIEGGNVICSLCPHGCTIAPGKFGICRVRNNIEGTLYTHNYGKISSIAMDPMEKKPLYHFFPGSFILSIGTVGCNFRCSFCQNYQIAQRGVVEQGRGYSLYEASEDYLLNLCRKDEECIGVAYTYNEPTVWFEYVYDMAKLIRSEGYKNVLITNGYISVNALSELLPYIDAMNIDVKGFTEEYYRNVCGGSLEHVKRTVEAAAAECHIEITTLIVPGHNDSEKEMRELSKWLSSISPSIPLHLSRYFPKYKMEEQPTPEQTLIDLKKVADSYLEYVYIGNMQSEAANTYCPQCGALLIRRRRGIFIEHLDDGLCTKCGKVINIAGV